MKRAQTDQYRDQLQKLSDRVGRTAAGLEDQARTATGGEAGGGLSNAPLHLGDMGSAAYSQELGATLLENETYIRDEALAALERIDAGTYGRCEHCGADIIPERLEVIPYTRYCTPCAAKLQDGRAVNMNDGRPDGWLGAPGGENANPAGSPNRIVGRDVGGAPDDVHAVGTPGGGTATGGLAGTNVGRGDVDDVPLEAAAGSGREDQIPDTDGEDQPEAVSGSGGGAVGGTPANKRARGGRGKK
jgi:RNA polymerase-binding transcription factor DksA